MKITSVRVIKKENSRMKAIAEVVLDDCFVVKGIKVIEGDNGLFLGMPSRTIVVNNDGKDEIVHVDIANPINKETRKMFTDAILEEYEKIK